MRHFGRFSNNVGCNPNKKKEKNVFLYFFCLFRALFEFLRLGFLFFFPAHERSISGEVALVTGAGQGIGRALALDLAKKGAIVICVDIRTDTNEETVRLVQQNSGVAFAFTCDVAEREQVEDLAIKVKSEVGDISILINNAGVLYCRPFLQHSARQIENVISTNLMGKQNLESPLSLELESSACMLLDPQQHLAFMYGPMGLQRETRGRRRKMKRFKPKNPLSSKQSIQG